MKTETLVIVAGLGLVALYLATQAGGPLATRSSTDRLKDLIGGLSPMRPSAAGYVPLKAPGGGLGFIQGVTQGAGTGALGGPWGAAGGAVGGGILSMFV